MDIIAVKITFNYEPCSKTIEINIAGNKESISFSAPDTVDLGEIIYCKDSIKTSTFNVTNLSAATVVGAIKEIISTSGEFTTNIQKNDSIYSATPSNYLVTFKPAATDADGVYCGSVKFQITPCDTILTTYFKAKKSSISMISSDLTFATILLGNSAQGNVVSKIPELLQ